MGIRTEEEVQREMIDWEPGEDEQYQHPQDIAFNGACYTACVMFLKKAPEEREAWLGRRIEWSTQYVSRGDDEDDARASGYREITRWLLGLFEWGHEGDELPAVSGA